MEFKWLKNYVGIMLQKYSTSCQIYQMERPNLLLKNSSTTWNNEIFFQKFEWLGRRRRHTQIFFYLETPRVYYLVPGRVPENPRTRTFELKPDKPEPELCWNIQTRSNPNPNFKPAGTRITNFARKIKKISIQRAEKPKLFG